MAKNVTQKLLESHWVEGRINPREEIGLPRFARPQRVRKTEPVLAYFVVSENQEVVMALTIKPEKLLINHEWVEAQNGKRFEVVNPAIAGISMLKNPLRLTHCYTRRAGR